MCIMEHLLNWIIPQGGMYMVMNQLPQRNLIAISKLFICLRTTTHSPLIKCSAIVPGMSAFMLLHYPAKSQTIMNFAI